MDGVLAEFKKVNSIDKLYEKGYFANLKPMQNVIAAIDYIHDETDIEVNILTSFLSDSNYAKKEKMEWLDKYLPDLLPSNYIFVPYGIPKRFYISDRLSRSDFLLDDYTPNLLDWNKKGTGIKLLNGINNTNGTWVNRNGLCVKHDDKELEFALIELCSSEISAKHLPTNYLYVENQDDLEMEI